MHFLSPRLIELALCHYAQIDASSVEQSNRFFETFGPGNVLHRPVQPHERFEDYEDLLQLLWRESPERYRTLHKGTPFYFMAWLAFDLRNFEKALLYLDAAISEDVRQDPDGWPNAPAGRFLALHPEQPPVGRRTVPRIRQYLDREVNRFAAASGCADLTIGSFLQDFVRVLLTDPGTRNILSAFYVFLLEAEDRYNELCLRSSAGGSTGPAISLLFRGGLILESLLKHLYPDQANGALKRSLGAVYQCPAFTSDFAAGFATGASSLQEILDQVQGDSLESAFNTTARLRNTTGHNLVWDDVFANPERLRLLFQQEVNALFYVVHRKYLLPAAEQKALKMTQT